MSTWSVIVETASAVGEFAIAAVIYFEIEAQRASSFLTGVQSDEFYKGRRRLYDEFVGIVPPESSLKERSAAFGRRIWEDPELRAEVDLQWAYIYRLRYAVRWSLVHRRIVAKWFPQVLVSLWVMTNCYLREREGVRPYDISDYGIRAVKESLGVIGKRAKRRGAIPILIYGGNNQRVVIQTAVIQEMQTDLDKPFT